MCFFLFFHVFLYENKTKQHDFNTFRKPEKKATTIVLWENSPKKEGAYPKREMYTERLQNITDTLQKSNTDYKVKWIPVPFLWIPLDDRIPPEFHWNDRIPAGIGGAL
jgi:hypothetical protein